MSSTQSTQQTQSEEAATGAEAIGAPTQSLSDMNAAFNSPATALADGRRVRSIGLGTCANGQEFFSPDKNGDASSMEVQSFYDQSCTQLARDLVLISKPNGSSSETLTQTMTLYALGDTTPSAVRTSSITVSNTQLDQYGFPLASAGSRIVSTSELDLSGVKTIVSDNEVVQMPVSGAVSTFCTDSAGFNATGFSALNETLGWQSLVSSATRTVNSDGSITYSGTHTVSSYKGANGSLSVVTGTPNTACPISTPMFTLSGGTQLSSSSIPVTVTFTHSIISNLTITNAQLANGDTINVSTSTNLSPSSTQFISGTIVNSSGTTISTLTVDAFGDGTLTVTSTSKQFVITNWHVVR